jgi:hypothetical protein
MRIDMVTPKRTYLVVSPSGDEVARFKPGDIMAVSRCRPTADGDILSVSCHGKTFDIPERDVFIMNEHSLV